MRHQNILVLGGSGFIGTQLIARLSTQGRRIRVPTRRYKDASHLQVLPTVELVETDINADGALAPLLDGIDAVINLVGILHGARGEPYGADFAAAHVELPRRIADTCRAAGIRRLVHMSALGVDETDPSGVPSMYLRSRAAGEQLIRDAGGLDWSIFRPSVVFGEEDHFTRLFARLSAVLPFVPLARADALLQPIWVGDVAAAICNSLDRTDTFGRCYPLAGPEVISLGDIVRQVAQWAGHPRPVMALANDIGRLQATIMEFLPGPTLMSRDNFDSLSIPNVSSEAIAPELGVHPAPMATIAPGYLSGVETVYSSRRERAHR